MSALKEMQTWVHPTVLKNKVAIVSGGGSGIGKAIALALAAAGAKVVVAGRRMEKLEEVAGLINSDGGIAMAVSTDVSKQADIDNLMAATVKAYGTLDILSNNSGVSIPRTSTLDVTREDWHKVMDVNMDACFFMAQGAARIMSKNGGGRIINMTSLRGTNALPNIVPYCTSKGAVTSMTKALAVDLASMNINVNAVAPGYVPTDMVAGLMADKDKVKGILDRTPLGIMGTVEEVAAAVMYFCLPQTTYTTGHVMVLDGGWSCF